MSLQLKESKYLNLIDLVLAAGRVPLLLGAPGTAKSSYLQETARRLNLLYIDVRLAGMDQTDIAGIPNFVDVFDSKGKLIGKRTAYIPNSIFPLVGMGDEERLLKWNEDGTPKLDAKGKQEQYEGFLINLEEFTSASEEVRAACYQLILDRQVGQHKLLPNVHLVACGNRATDGAIASSIGTALQSRVTTIEVQTEMGPWMYWASKNGIHPNILDYLAWRPEFLNNFDPNTDDLTFACQRTWEMLSDIMHAEGSYSEAVHELALGTVGKVAVEFKQFISYYAKLPDIKKILADPKNADMPTEPGHVYALAGVMASNIGEAAKAKDSATVSKLMEYVERMPQEMQTVSMASALRSVKATHSQPTILKWIGTNSASINAVL